MHLATAADGVPVAHELLGGSGPPLLLAHATGFCGSVWRPVARRLAGRHRCWTLDFRGHGRSGRPADGRFDWVGTGLDVLAVLDAAVAVDGAAATGPWVGVGHSMGGAALLRAELDRPGTFRALWLYEPVVFPPVAAADDDGTDGNHLARGAERRRARFESREQARANYAAKPPMASFDPEALDAYLDGGLRSDDDGTVVLRCAPADEAQVYRMGARHDTWTRLGEIGCPVTVVAGAPAPFGPGAVAAELAERLPQGRLETHPELSHFGPMEDPAAVAASIELSVGGPSIGTS